MKIKNVLIAALVATSFFSGMAYAAGKDKAGIKMEESVHDFGIIKEDGGPVSHEFQFVNDGDANLVIFGAQVECGCTTPEFPRQPIAPGKKGKIKVTYNPLGRPGSFDKVVTIKSNGKSGKVRLKVKGRVNAQERLTSYAIR